ncbi:FtsW/RodA/SpoVE family cell cycle protein [Stratiformator vulcanicus]|uniref:FtsW/RodA/SpoVE family cell cycle protein n=1 Tax=Stratiformator vulcanicus TaxID=2527980 RepID=UPI0011A239E1|nr:FtsW/RodA/SpoVE family cell cycle protein [Stratiformator vulcanicus]
MRTTHLDRFPWLAAICVVGLLLIGLSAIDRGDEIAGQGRLALKQCLWVAISLPVAIAATCVPYAMLKRLAPWLLLAAVVLLIAVYFMPPRNGARRWIPLGPVFFQPSELAKIAFVAALARYLTFRESHRRVWGLIPPFLFALVPALLIVREPDLGTSLVFLPVLMAMLFAAGAKKRHLIAVTLLGVAAAPIVWLGMNAEQKSRVVTLVTQRDQGEAPRGDGYHLFQSKRMHSVGGLWGSELTGVPPVNPAIYHLPAARTDFVFCLVTERWGLAGATLTLTLYGLLFWNALGVARRTHDPFGRLLVVGVTSLLAVQAMINVSMTVGLAPITGLPLPLLSYGGSSLLFTVVAVGLIFNVALRPGLNVGPEAFRFESTRRDRPAA